MNLFVFFVIAYILINCVVSEEFEKPADTDYTPDELTALEELKTQIGDELEEDYMKTDEYLINFLRAKLLNVPKTAALVKQTMKWWRDTEMSSVMDESFPTFEKQYPYKLDFVDNEGRPVILMSFGRWNLRNIIISGQKAQILRYYDQMLERALTKVREIREKTGEDVNRFNIVADMNGYSFTTHGCLNCIPLILDFARHLETYYAARAIRIYTLNTPRLFIPVFELMKPLLSPTTAKGFKIMASNKDEWKKELLKIITKDQLPVEYGGSAKKKPKLAKTTTTSTSTTTTTTATPATKRPKQRTTKSPKTTSTTTTTQKLPSAEEYDCEYD